MSALATETPRSQADGFRAGIGGVYRGISSDEYHALRAISSTVLKRLHCESPKHAHAVLEHPELIGSDELTIGDAAHSLTLTPDEFAARFVCAEQCTATVKSSGKRCEHSGTALTEDGWLCGIHGKGRTIKLAGVEVLTNDQWRRVAGIRDALWNHPLARKLMLAATGRELSVLWQENAVLCKARFDLVCEGVGILPDIKTCRSANPDWFTAQAWKMGYHIQLAHYLKGADAAGIKMDVSTIIAVENEEPFDVVVFEPAKSLIEYGRIQRDEAIKTLADCELTGDWPGFATAAVPLVRPEWAK